MSVEGPIARSVADLAFYFAAIAEPDIHFTKSLARDFKGTRVAWWNDLGGIPIDSRVREITNAQRRVFESFGCIVEEAEPDFTGADAAILGISKDSEASHDKFKKKYGLDFTLVSDTDGAICEAFGVWVEKMNYGKKYMGIERSTFLIGPDGVVRGVWRKVKVDGHVDKVLAAAKALG